MERPQSRPVGRPKLPDHKKRVYRTQEKWTEAEWQRLHELAKGVPLARFIRESVLMRVS